jgi:glyoxylase-like metal-dependent hydrolase (beta-lactamase superfamily II)
MNESVRSIQLGAATVTLIDVGELLFSLADWLPVPEHKRPPDFARPIPFPTQCVHLALPGASILVDASRFDPAESPHANPGYQPPPGLLDGLSAAGISPEAIEHVVITHAHRDHFNGITRQEGGYQPWFPNARHYLGRADWQAAQAALGDPSSLESHTLGVLWQAGLLVPVDSQQELCEGVVLVPAPGETPGHQILRVSCDGQALLCIGDIYHHPLEVAHADWFPAWADTHELRATRQRLHADALASNALLIATHIAGVGRLARGPQGVGWVAI